jgi:hypothetical protein
MLLDMKGGALFMWIEASLLLLYPASDFNDVHGTWKTSLA